MEGEDVEDMYKASLKRGKGGSKGNPPQAAGGLEEASTNKRGLLLGYQNNGRDIPGTSVRGLQMIGKKECGFAMKT